MMTGLKWGHLVLALTIVLIAITILGAVNYSGVNFRIYLIPEKSSYIVGEPIDIKVVVENRSNRPLSFGNSSRMTRGYMNNGIEVCTDYYLNYLHPIPDIPAKGSWDAPYNWFPASQEAGNYTVWIEIWGNIDLRGTVTVDVRNP
jgi:hypothetical protein